MLRGIRNNDVAGGDDGSFCQTAGDGAAHISCTDNCCFHIILSFKKLSSDKGKDFNEKTTETGRYSSFGRIFCRLIIRKLSKCFLKTFQEEVRFVHAETQGRQQAEYVRAADTGKHMLFFQ